MVQDGPQFAASHVAHTFDCMLSAATLWAVADPRRAHDFPPRLGWTAEYAAFAHQRALYELFCSNGGAYESRKLLGHAQALNSPLWTDWEPHLNTAALHLHGRWEEKDPVVRGSHLKDQVAAFACDIIKLWIALEGLVPDVVARSLRGARERIFFAAASSAAAMQAPGLDWSRKDPFAAWGERKWWPTPLG